MTHSLPYLYGYAFYSDHFDDVKNVKMDIFKKGQKFLVASWGDVFDNKTTKSNDGEKSSSSCMTDHNGPLEDVFEECKVQIKK